jgi:hypothetical protein
MGFKKSIVLALPLAAAILLTVAPAFAQENVEEKRAVGGVAELPGIVRPATCPHTETVTLDAKTQYVLTTDIGAIKNYTTQLGYNKADTAYLHTFVWKRGRRCCQVVKAVMNVQMTALLGGSNPPGGNDSGNDNISIIHAGMPIPPFNKRIYTPPPFQAGHTASQSWNLTGTALADLNANGYLTLYVEDDTQVNSATLQLTICCLDDLTRGKGDLHGE